MNQQVDLPTHQQPRNRTSRLRVCLSVFSSTLILGSVALWVMQPTGLIALLYVPVGGWVTVGLLTAVMGQGHRWRQSLIASWLTLCIVLSEPVWSIPRGWFQAPFERRLRVVSLNCNVGNQAAAREVIKLRPDLVLFQETVSKPVAQEVARELWADTGAVAATAECSIIADGNLRVLAADPAAAFVLCEWTTRAGESCLVASVRLAPPATRLDLWNDAARQEHADRCRNRAQVIEHLLKLIAKHHKAHQLVLIGGDFNTVPKDRTLLNALSSQAELQFRDSFSLGGVGWGDTVLNDFPFQRFDQIWLTQKGSIPGVRCAAVGTANSDHRLALCDIGR